MSKADHKGLTWLRDVLGREPWRDNGAGMLTLGTAEHVMGLFLFYVRADPSVEFNVMALRVIERKMARLAKAGVIGLADYEAVKAAAQVGE